MNWEKYSISPVQEDFYIQISSGIPFDVISTGLLAILWNILLYFWQ